MFLLTFNIPFSHYTLQTTLLTRFSGIYTNSHGHLWVGNLITSIPPPLFWCTWDPHQQHLWRQELMPFLLFGTQVADAARSWGNASKTSGEARAKPTFQVVNHWNKNTFEWMAHGETTIFWAVLFPQAKHKKNTSAPSLVGYGCWVCPADQRGDEEGWGRLNLQTLRW